MKLKSLSIIPNLILTSKAKISEAARLEACFWVMIVTNFKHPKTRKVSTFVFVRSMKKKNYEMSHHLRNTKLIL